MLPQVTQYDAVHAILERYLEIVGFGRAELISSVFHPNALIAGYAFFPGGPSEGTFVAVPAVTALTEYLKSAPPVSETSPGYRARIIDIDVVGPFASGRVLEESLDGRDFVSHFHLHQIEGKWLVTSKSMVSVPARD
jgi:Putative lumazine-binding